MTDRRSASVDRWWPGRWEITTEGEARQVTVEALQEGIVDDGTIAKAMAAATCVNTLRDQPTEHSHVLPPVVVRVCGDVGLLVRRSAAIDRSLALGAGGSNGCNGPVSSPGSG